MIVLMINSHYDIEFKTLYFFLSKANGRYFLICDRLEFTRTAQLLAKQELYVWNNPYIRITKRNLIIEPTFTEFNWREGAIFEVSKGMKKLVKASISDYRGLVDSLCKAHDGVPTQLLYNKLVQNPEDYTELRTVYEQE